MSRIWIPEASMINLNRFVEFFYETPPVLIAGRYRWEVISKRSGLIKRFGPWEPNLIVDAGLEGLATSGILAMCTYLAVGTGNAVPAVTDTGLQAESARTSNTDNTGAVAATYDTTDASNPFWYTRISRLFASPAVNTNYTECGAFKNASGSPMLSRSLLKDAGGNATAVTVHTDEQLRLVFEYRVYPPMTDTVTALTATVRGSNVSTTATTRAINISTTNVWGWGVSSFQSFSYLMPSGGNHSAGPGAVWETNVQPAARTGAPTGYTVDRSSGTRSAYVTNSRYYDSTLTWNAGVVLPSSGQIGGFTHFACYSGNSLSTNSTFFTSLSTKLNVTNQDKVIAGFRHSWARKP